MEQEFIDIITKMTADNGAEILLNPKRAKAFLSDYIGSGYKKEGALFQRVLDTGFPTLLAEVSPPALAEAKRGLVKRLETKLFLAPQTAAELIDLLGFVLRGDTSKTPVEAPPPASPPPPSAANTAASMALVPAGTFMMGSDADDAERGEQPVHQVTLSRAFSMGKYPVTQKEWMELMDENPSEYEGDTLPVECIAWYDAVEYCNRRSEAEGLVPAYSGKGSALICDFDANGYRLPTEAEWEWAARSAGKEKTRYSGGDSADRVAWYEDNSGGEPHPVGRKAPNALGIYDMSGNIGEYCGDWYDDYSDTARTDPKGPASCPSGKDRVIRGGGFDDPAEYITVTTRTYSSGKHIGFRVVHKA
jgi:formylglycine-generating enzyme required for sulfatase activity